MVRALFILYAILVTLPKFKAQETTYYDVEISNRMYVALTEFDIVFDGNSQETFESGYLYDYLLETAPFYFGRQFEQIRINKSGEIRLSVSGNRASPQTIFFGGLYDNLGLINSARPTFIKKHNISTNTTKALVVQFENLGLKADIESPNPSDHYLNFQVWFHFNGDIEFIMGPTNLDSTDYYDIERGFLSSGFSPIGGPIIGIRYPDLNLDTIYHFVQGTVDNPIINHGQIDIQPLLGVPEEGWSIIWKEKFADEIPIEQSQCYPETGFFPLEYTGGMVQWKNSSFDSTIVGHIKPTPPSSGGLVSAQSTTTGYNNFENTYPVSTLVLDDYLISIDRMFYFEPSGALIRKIDLVTGEEIWRTHYDYRDSQENEYIIEAEVENDVLIVYGIHINHLFQLENAQAGVLFTREYDIGNGDLINYTVGDVNNPIVHEESYFLYYRNELNRLSQDTFEVLDYEYVENKPAMSRTVMTRSGIPFVKDTIYGMMEIPENIDVNFSEERKVLRLSIDSLIFIEHFEPENYQDEEPYFLFHLMDQNFDIIYTKRYDKFDIGQFNGVFISDADTRYTRLISYIPEMKHILIDNKNGSLIDIRYEDIEIEDPEQRFLVTNLNSNNEIVAVKTNELGNQITPAMKGELEFIFSNGQRDTTTSILEPSENRYYIFPKEIFLLDDYDVLLRVFEARFSFNGQYLPGFYSYLRIDSEELLGITSTEDIKKHPGFSISPNPAFDYVAINYPEIFNGRILLYNTEGYLVSTSICNGESINLNITDLPLGLYTIRSVGNDSNIEYKAQKLLITR